MNVLIDLLRSSVLTQAVITVMTLSVVFYLVVTGKPVPPEVWALASLVVGFYFGSKVGVVQGQNSVRKTL